MGRPKGSTNAPKVYGPGQRGPGRPPGSKNKTATRTPKTTTTTKARRGPAPKAEQLANLKRAIGRDGVRAARELVEQHERSVLKYAYNIAPPNLGGDKAAQIDAAIEALQVAKAAL